MKIRRVYTDAPAFIPIPKALQHRKVEVFFQPLDCEASAPLTTPSTWQNFFAKYSREVDEISLFQREQPISQTVSTQLLKDHG
jgi:hypothetical protein